MRPRPRSALRCRRDARQRACCREERAQGTGHRRATRTSACGAEMSAAVRERRALEGLMARTSVLLGMFAIAAAACGGGVKGSETPLAPVGAKVVKVEAGQVPQVVDLYGTVEAERTAAVSSRVMATVTAVRVQPGDVVRQGQVLVEIDPATTRGQEGQARGGLAQAQAALALAERNLERFKALAAKGAASELELDMATMQYQQAKGAVAQGEGAVEATSSVAREWKVVAPFAGRVAAKLVEVGDLAAPGRPLVMVESATGRRLVVAVPETVLAASGLKVGAPVAVRIDTQPGGGADGRVSEVYPSADPMSHAFTEGRDQRGGRGGGLGPRGDHRRDPVRGGGAAGGARQIRRPRPRRGAGRAGSVPLARRDARRRPP